MYSMDPFFEKAYERNFCFAFYNHQIAYGPDVWNLFLSYSSEDYDTDNLFFNQLLDFICRWIFGLSIETELERIVTHLLKSSKDHRGESFLRGGGGQLKCRESIEQGITLACPNHDMHSGYFALHSVIVFQLVRYVSRIRAPTMGCVLR